MPYVTTSSEYRGRTVKRGKLAIWLGLSLVLGVLIVIGRNGYGLGEKHAEPSRLSAVMATVGPVRDIIIAKGTVAYDHQFVLRSQIAGKVVRLTVKEGDEVVRGQHLLRICDDGKTVMVTHDATLANFSDRVVELSDGRVCS